MSRPPQHLIDKNLFVYHSITPLKVTIIESTKIVMPEKLIEIIHIFIEVQYNLNATFSELLDTEVAVTYNGTKTPN